MAAKHQIRVTEVSFSLQKPVILLMAAGIIIMFMTSFLGGGNIPGERSSKIAQNNDDAMAEIPALMAKLKDNPKDTDTLQDLAEAFSRAKDWEKAAVFWSKMIDILPEDINALNHRGAALMRINRYDEAAADYEKILLIRPKEAHALFNLGLIHKYGFQNKEKARDYFQQALAKKPNEAGLVKAIQDELQP
jgi:tetratricopeptide (TPR) repeat protein